MPIRAFSVVALAVSCVAVNPATAQRSKEPSRPRLAATRDTNSALEYLAYGLDSLAWNAAAAANAFYWSSRLDPRSADALYARRVAWFYQSPRRILSWARGTSYLESSEESAQIDSAYVLALLRDPFVRPKFDAALVVLFNRQLRAEGYILRRGIAKFSQAGWLALTQGAYRDAADLYQRAIRMDSKNEFLYVQRANAFFYLHEYDSAAAQFEKAIAKIRERENKKAVVVYASKAMYEYAAGHALLFANKLPAAREAFGRAMVEDLSFYMAHVRLASLAARQGDTAAALDEYETAVHLRGDDAVLRFDYGALLAAVGRFDAAAEQFTKAIELEPYYAPPYVWLASVEDSDDKLVKARQHYEEFLARSPRTDPRIAGVKARLASMGPSP